jgi:hypothetical protein
MAPASRLAERVSVRLPDPLRAWVVDYALMRGVPVSAIVVAALEEFRELCASGVPDLPAGDGRSVGVGRVRAAGTRASSSPGAPVVSRPAAGAPAERPPEEERPLDEPEPDELGGIPPSQPSPDEPAPAKRPRPQRSREDAVRAQWLRERQAKLNRVKGW